MYEAPGSIPCTEKEIKINKNKKAFLPGTGLASIIIAT
jgi:hypothetical protein